MALILAVTARCFLPNPAGVVGQPHVAVGTEVLFERGGNLVEAGERGGIQRQVNGGEVAGELAGIPGADDEGRDAGLRQGPGQDDVGQGVSEFGGGGLELGQRVH